MLDKTFCFDIWSRQVSDLAISACAVCSYHITCKFNALDIDIKYQRDAYMADTGYRTSKPDMYVN